MKSITRTMNIMLAGVALPLLAGCGASEIASPGGGGVTVNVPSAPTPTPSPTPTPVATVSPAAACPTIGGSASYLTNDGTITGPTGTWRVCSLPSIVSRSVTLPKIAGVLYQMKGRVDVGCDGGFSAPTAGAPVTSTTVGCTAANGFTLNGSGQLTADSNVTLTIEPGVIVFAQPGATWLAVNRGNKISAVGTASQPIIFTSRENIQGLTNDNSIGQWGGVVLLGRGIITDCNTGSAGACERQTEGAVDPAVFGGADNAYNAGAMQYVQLRYSGYVLSSTFELQALTTGGTGTGTTLDYIQSHNSSDDAMEFFGGAVNFKHYVATGADDDSLDADTGIRARFQHVLIVQRPGQGDGLFEIDSNGNETQLPRSDVMVANFTAIQTQASSNNDANNQASIMIRGNSDNRWANGIIVSPNNECLRMNGTGTAPVSLVARSVVMQCNATKYLGTGSLNAAAVAAAFGSGANGNNDAYTPSLTGVFINGAAETAVTAIDPKTLDAFFDTTNYIGAVKDANESWFKGWTCNSGYAAFDNVANANRACSSLPVT